MEQIRNTRKKRRRPPCLACGAPFRSESPFLRICPLCKAGEEWLSGSADFVLHAPANDNGANDNEANESGTTAGGRRAGGNAES